MPNPNDDEEEHEPIEYSPEANLLKMKYGVDPPQECVAEFQRDKNKVQTYVLKHERVLVQLKSESPETASVPLLRRSNAEPVKIVAIGCDQWSINGNTAVGIHMKDFPTHLKVGDDACVAGFPHVGQSNNEPQLWFYPTPRMVISYIPQSVTEDNYTAGIDKVKTGTNDEAWHLPIGLNDDGEPICPIGYITYEKSKADKKKYVIKKNYDNQDGLLVSKEGGMELMRAVLKSIKDPRMSVDLFTFKLQTKPLFSGGQFSLSVALDVFYS